jgi:hypothetical protein
MLNVPEVPDVAVLIEVLDVPVVVELLLPPQAVTNMTNAASVHSAGARFILILSKSRSSESQPLA